MGTPRHMCPPAAAPPPRARFKPASGRAGAGKCPRPFPISLQARQFSISAAVTARAHAPTNPYPNGSHNRAHIHTHSSSKQRVWTPCPLSPHPLRRGRGIPSPGPLRGKFMSASCGGEKDPVPRREGTRTKGFPRSPRMPSPGTPFEGFRPASRLGDVCRGPRMLGIPW